MPAARQNGGPPVTSGSLRCDIPVLLPDEAFVRRLAELAAGSTTSPGVVVPGAFGRPATRAVAAAAAVAAITAGAAAAADQLTGSHESPAPPISTRVTQAPSTPPSDDADAGPRDRDAATRPVGPGSRRTSDPWGGVFLTDPSRTHSPDDHAPGNGPTADPGDRSGPDHDGTDHDGTDHSGPGDGDPSEGGDDGDSGSDEGHSGPGNGSGDGSDGPSADGSVGSDDGSGSGPGSGD